MGEGPVGRATGFGAERRLASLTGFRVALLLAVCAFRAAWGAGTDVHSAALNYEPLAREAYSHFYNLDYDGALMRFERVRAAHPGDPMATTYVLNCLLFKELYRLDLLDTTFYANDGFLSGKHTVAEDPEAEKRIEQLADEAIEQAEREMKLKPGNEDALFARGWARSLKATYLAMVQRSYMSGLHLAIQARSDHERVLRNDPKYVDAKMVVGIHEFIAGSLPFAFKMVVGLTGMGGSKEKGMELLRDAAAHGVITSVESRTCMALFLRREGKYKDAIRIVRSQAAEFPRDFLFALEVANLLKDDGQGQAAILAYQKLLTEAKVPGRYPNAHLELAWFGLGETLRGQNRRKEAIEAFQQAAAQPTVSGELRRRSLLEAGEVYEADHETEQARLEYQAVIAAGPDSAQADQARRYLRAATKR